jgi:4-amino-4-deoxy-L-arabinose transferase-like glycosyltransferase
VLALVGIVTVLRLAYLAWLCPYALIEDEAHYWEWSRHLDWSYYSKGPGIAWVIAAAVRVLGESEFAVRAPAVLAAAVAAAAGAGLAREATGERRAGVYAAACLMLAPIYQFNAVLMTIDMPYLAAWAAACWMGWRVFGGERAARGTGGRSEPRPPVARGGGGGRAWAALGAALAVGFLFKYTILLLVPGMAVFAWMGRRERGWSWRAAGGALGIAALGLIPVGVWNARNGWPTVHHLLGHLGVAAGDVPVQDRAGWAYEPRWTLEFVGIQAAVLGPVMYLGLVGLARGLRGEGRRGFVYLLCCGLPIVAFYLGVTLFTEVEGNWASAGYVTLVAAAGWAAATGVAGARRDLARSLWRASVAVGVLAAVLSLRLDWVAASAPIGWLDRGLQRAGWKQDDRPLIPAGRLMGAPLLARDVGALAEELRERTGQEPFYVAEHYGRASLLAFYLPGHPVVYCSSSAMDEGRKTQYDYWADTDLTDMAVLGGRPAVCLGKTRERWEEAFEEVEERGRLAHEPKKDRLVFLGLVYRGFGYREPAGGARMRR